MISNRSLVFGVIGAIAVGSAAAFALPAPPALALAVTSAAGDAVRLEYRDAHGWRALPGGEGAHPKRVALSPAAESAQPLAVFVDRPTAATFVYLPEQGWQYAGRSNGAEGVDAASPANDQAMTMFVDGPTGFVFTYAAEKGWRFAGRVVDLQR